MLTKDIREKLAADLHASFSTKEPVPLISVTYPDFEMDDAYSIQQQVVEKLQNEGRKIAGYKIGLTSKVMQEFAGLNEPDFGTIMDDMVLENGATVATDAYLTPRVESEIAFVMKEPLSGPGVTAEQVLQATDYIVPAIELVDFRVKLGPGFTILDSIADLAAVGGIVLGDVRVSPDDIDLCAISNSLLINGEERSSGVSSAVMDNPVNAVVWLANMLGKFDVAFKPGDVIISGSIIEIQTVAKGDEVVATFGSGLGDVKLSFA